MKPLILTSTGVMGGGGVTRTAYNPTTNEIKRIDYGLYRNCPDGFHNLGYGKIAEAFTKVKADERPALWLALKSNKYYGIDLTMLKSSVRCELKRLGLRQLRPIRVSLGESTLARFAAKKDKTIKR